MSYSSWYKPWTWFDAPPAPSDTGSQVVGTQAEQGREYRYDTTRQEWVDVGSAPGLEDVYEDFDTGGTTTTRPSGAPTSKSPPLWAIALGAAGGLLVVGSIYSAVTNKPKPNRLAGYRGCGCR